MATLHFAERRHPWLATFESAPAKAFGDLLAGYAEIHPYERADSPDAARMLFGPLDEADDARKALGPAIISWLENRRIEAVPAAPAKLQRRVREICEAFEIVALLRVADAAIKLRNHFVVWNEWVANLVLSPARDARAEYWRMLGLTQPLVAIANPQIDQWGLAPLWQLTCRDSGGLLPARYLDIGLLGLRYLPDHSNGSELPWVSGLAHWALARNPSKTEFKAAWFALKPLYPRATQRWRKLVGELLSTKIFADSDIKAPAWWDVDPDFKPMAKPRFSAPSVLRSPSPQDCRQVIAKIGDSFDVVELRINQLMDGHRLFVQATGSSYFLVRAIHVLGQALIETGADDPHGRAAKAQALAREGLDWEPNDPYLWSLWRDALVEDGNFHAAEMVGWEFVRRLPENPDSRNQLATLLAESLGRPDEAEALLRDTITVFPDDAVARNQLATLLAESLGRPEEAEVLLRESIRLDGDDPIPRNQLATLLAESLGRPEEAEAVLREAMRLDPDNPIPRNQLATILAKSLGRPEEAEAVLKETIQLFSDDPIPRNQLAAFLISANRKSEAVGVINTCFDDNIQDAVTYELRARLNPTNGQAEPALKTAQDGLHAEPSDPGLTQFKEILEDSKPMAPVTSVPRQNLLQTPTQIEPAIDPNMESVVRFGEVRRLRFRMEGDSPNIKTDATESLQRFLRDNPTFAYAELLAARHRMWEAESNSLPPVAVAFENALATEDRAKLEELAKREKRLDALIIVARAVLGDVEAAQIVETLLRQPDASDDDRGVAVLRSGLRPIFKLIEDGRPITHVFTEKRAVIIRVLHDANEAMLGGILFAA